MRHRSVWPFTALLTLALAACNLGSAPTPEPNTPTPRARAEQVARATEVAAQITATAVARSQPTNTPTPRATVAPRPTFAAQPGNGKPLKATPIEWNAAPLEDGYRYRDPAGQFALNWVLHNKFVTSVLAGPRTFEQWTEYLGALEHRFTAADEALVDKLVPPGHPSTPGYTDPKFPIRGRVPRG